MLTRLRLLSHTDLSAWGYTSRLRRTGWAGGLLVPLRAGVFALREEWDRASPEERIVTRARALASVAAEPPVFSHETAAAMLGLPLYSPDPLRVHAIVSERRSGAPHGVVRHRGILSPDHVVDVDGLRCTSLTRTVSDVARTAPVEQAVAVADAALRLRFGGRRDRYDADGVREFTSAALDTARLSAHGAARAGRVLAFADGRSDRPGESVSRVRLAQLGFRAPRLQVCVPAPQPGKNFYVDFGLDDAGAHGEFDGRIKYVDGRLLLDRSADEVFEAEKEREDWIRGVTGRPLVRWGWSHISTPRPSPPGFGRSA